MLLFTVMKKTGFTLLELLIVVAIIATLVGVAMPYFENYVKDTRMAKAKHELDLLREALIKFDTFEDKKFVGTDTSVLIGKYIQNIPFDPWGRAYEVDPSKGCVKSRGPDSTVTTDDIVVDYKPPLALVRATWIDGDNNQHISSSDSIRLEFTRPMTPSVGDLTLSNLPAGLGDLSFSSEVNLVNLVATQTPASTTELYIRINPVGLNLDSTFFPGSSTVRVASSNVLLIDVAGRKANGSTGQYGVVETTIQAN